MDPVPDHGMGMPGQRSPFRIRARLFVRACGTSPGSKVPLLGRGDGGDPDGRTRMIVVRVSVRVSAPGSRAILQRSFVPRSARFRRYQVQSLDGR